MCVYIISIFFRGIFKPAILKAPSEITYNVARIIFSWRIRRNRLVSQRAFSDWFVRLHSGAARCFLLSFRNCTSELPLLSPRGCRGNRDSPEEAVALSFLSLRETSSYSRVKSQRGQTHPCDYCSKKNYPGVWYLGNHSLSIVMNKFREFSQLPRARAKSNKQSKDINII